MGQYCFITTIDSLSFREVPRLQRPCERGTGVKAPSVAGGSFLQRSDLSYSLSRPFALEPVMQRSDSQRLGL